MEIILSTRNPSKAGQIKAIFAGLPISIRTLDDVGIKGDAVEDGKTLEENSLKKAWFAHTFDSWAMADDTGLFIDALGGRPGIYAARWAGETATTDEITQYTLDQLKSVKDRSATFRTTVALVLPSGEHKFFTGEVRGILLEAPRTRPQPKMPYSPLFIPEGTDKVWAEMTTEEENAISHRGKAFRLVRSYLAEQVG